MKGTITTRFDRVRSKRVCVIDSKKLSMMFFRKLAPGLDPGVVHPRTKSKDMLRGIML